MEIYPEDLGPSQCGRVLEDRLLRGGWGPTAAPDVLPSGRVLLPPRHRPADVWIYLFGSLWAAGAVDVMFHVPFWASLFFCGAIALLWRQRRGGRADLAAPVRRNSAASQSGTYACLTEPEITQLQNALLRPGSADPLLGLYLELVWAAMHLGPLAAGQAETEKNAREAIRALGGAIEALPPRTLDGVPDNHAKLQAIAAGLAADAPLESDPVVAASLHRRAEALRGQAETVARVRILLRRNGALRAELSDQIGALRTGLAAAALGGGDGGPELAGLAARIRRVASEANAVTAARVEVDALLSQRDARARGPAAEEEARQVLGLNGEAL